MPKTLPEGQALIMLAREYVDDVNACLESDALGFDNQIYEQKQFMKIVRWLIANNYA